MLDSMAFDLWSGRLGSESEPMLHSIAFHVSSVRLASESGPMLHTIAFDVRSVRLASESELMLFMVSFRTRESAAFPTPLKMASEKFKYRDGFGLNRGRVNSMRKRASDSIGMQLSRLEREAWITHYVKSGQVSFWAKNNLKAYGT